MDFDRRWTAFALEAEEGAFGFARIADAHNRAVAERNAALARAAAAEARVAEAETLLRRLVSAGARLDHSLVFRAAYVEAKAFLAGAPAAPPVALAAAVLAYDDAIRSCANDPSKMASSCTAEGDTLDKLYADMLRLAGHPKRADEAFDGAPAPPPSLPAEVQRVLDAACKYHLRGELPAELDAALDDFVSPSPGEGRPLDAEEPEESPKISRAPWTDAEVENLLRRQAARWLHPYTGPGHVNLIPSNEGWRLPLDGEIYQQWAWRSDVEGDIGTDPLERLRVASPGEGRPEAGDD